MMTVFLAELGGKYLKNLRFLGFLTKVLRILADRASVRELDMNVTAIGILTIAGIGFFAARVLITIL